jgi:hypothetical protein
MTLFEDDWGVDNSPEDKTEITTKILYLSQKQKRDLTKAAKRAMQLNDPINYQTTQHLEEIILTALNFYNDAKTNS